MSDLNASTLCDLTRRYRVTIGHGENSVIRTGSYPPYDAVAVKFIKHLKSPTDTCKEAHKSLKRNIIVYDGFTRFITCMSLHSINVVKPMKVVEAPCARSETPYGDDQYLGCALVTERVISPFLNNQTTHIVLSGNTHPEDLTMSVSAPKLTPKGYWCNSDALNEILMVKELNTRDISISTLHHRMGVLDGIMIFGCSLIPRGCAYVLGVNRNDPDFESSLAVTLMNFDQCLKIKPYMYNDISALSQRIWNILIYDPYHPRNSQTYLDGIRDATKCLYLTKEEGELVAVMMNDYSKI